MQVSNCVQQDPSRATNSSSAKQQELFRILWNRTPHHRVRKGLPLVPVPYLGLRPPILFLKIHFNIILPSSQGLPSGLFPSDFPPKLCMHFSTYDVPKSKPSVPLGNMSIFMVSPWRLAECITYNNYPAMRGEDSLASPMWLLSTHATSLLSWRSNFKVLRTTLYAGNSWQSQQYSVSYLPATAARNSTCTYHTIHASVRRLFNTHGSLRHNNYITLHYKQS